MNLNQSTTERIGRFEDKEKTANVAIRILAFIFDFIVFWIINFTLSYYFGTVSENGTKLSLSGLPALGMMLITLFFMAYK